MIIAILNGKGGTGKTTTAVHLADYLYRRGKTGAFIDADRLKSSSDWLKLMPNRWPFSATSDPEDLFEKALALNEQFDYVIIDGPAGMDAIAQKILDVAELVATPIQPSGTDINALKSVARSLTNKKRVRRDLRVVLFVNNAVKRTTLLRETVEAIESLPLATAKTVIHSWQCLRSILMSGQTVFDESVPRSESARMEYQQLFEELLNG